MSKLLEIHGVSKSFGKNKVLNDITLSLMPGRIAGLLGPNGAGKTTLFKILAQVYQADDGFFTINGEAADSSTKADIAYLPDKNHLYKWMKVRDAIRFHQDMFADFDRTRAEELSTSLQIKSKDMISSLSLGGLQRVRIMLAYSRQAKIYILDDPISDIDPLARQKILQTILSFGNESSSTIIATHMVKDVEMVLDDVVFIHKGSLIYSGSAETIREKHNMGIEDYYLETYKND